jgi:undecaprenyl diphosphate synthase
MMENGLRFRHIGRLQELSESLRRCIAHAEAETKNNKGLCVQLAFNYGARLEIVDAVKSIAQEVQSGRVNIGDIDEGLLARSLYTKDTPDPDLLVRTSGEERISNFLLWQLAYAEFYMTKKYWPDFSKREFLRAITEYQKRARRFGGVNG